MWAIKYKELATDHVQFKYRQAVNIASTDKTQRSNRVFSYVSSLLQHTKNRDLVLQLTPITFYLQRDRNILKALLQLRQKQLLMFTRKL